MVLQFWNVKLAPTPPTPELTSGPDASGTRPDVAAEAPHQPSDEVADEISGTAPVQETPENEYQAQEAVETATSLKDKQQAIESEVFRIWTVLSAFEESSASCISEMLRFVSAANYVDGVRMAEKFVVHVETLFAAIDDLLIQSRKYGGPEIHHVREARMLCKKVVNFFSLLSLTQDASRRSSTTQDLLALVTGLAHYLKILIRIALTAGLRLDRECNCPNAISHLLNRLDRLVRDPTSSSALSPVSPSASTSNSGRRPYGYKSLSRSAGTLIGHGEATSDLCAGCKQTIEEDCIRFGTSHRWHMGCLHCKGCGRQATREKDRGPSSSRPDSAFFRDFALEEISIDGSEARVLVDEVYCASCASSTCRTGFEHVTRLEQFAFLLCVALNKLYALLRQRGVVPVAPGELHSHAMLESLPDKHRRWVPGAIIVQLLVKTQLVRCETLTERPSRSQTVINDSQNAQALDCHPESCRQDSCV